MNWPHLTAFIWLRWRLMVNQSRRAGEFNAILMMIVAIGALVAAVPLFIGCFVFGLYIIPKAQPAHLMYAWDGLIVVFLFWWGIGLLIELQRTEPLALSKFLHLPVAPAGAFLINYLSSLVRLSLFIFGPVMLAFALAMVFAKGIMLLCALPLLAAFLLMITAPTYQFQGWLASLMNNPRRRRTVVVAVTLGFILICQIPNVVNLYAPWRPRRKAAQSTAMLQDMKTLDREFQQGRIDVEEHIRRQQKRMEQYKAAREQESRAAVERWERTARIANLALPIGWLPLGVMAAAEGSIVPPILCLLGMTLIGMVSLSRAYHTMIGQYQGQSSYRKSRPARAAASPATARKPGTLLLEARLPGISEPVSAVALATWDSIIRAPEAKMMLLTPLITGVIFGSMIWNGRNTLPQPVRPLIAIGAMLFVLLGLLQLMSNQFGFDRDGFRVFVLAPAQRKDILLGKNLAFAPLALGMAVIELLILQMLCPLRIDHFLATVPLYVSMFLLACLPANLMSIYAPLYLAAGSMKPTNPKLTTVLLQLVMFLVLFPLTQVPALLPLATEAGLALFDWTAGAPVCLLLSLAECAVVIFLYRWLLDWQGGLLEAREQRILEIVTNRAV